MVKFNDTVRLRPETDISRSNPRLADQTGTVTVVRFVHGPVLAATVQFEDVCLKGVPTTDLLIVS